MSGLKSQIGKTSSAFCEEVTPQRISAFCKAIGAKESTQAPPTFLTVLRRGEFELFQSLGIELSRVLHTDQEYEYENPILAGDSVRFVSTVANILEKSRSQASFQFVTLETEYYVLRGSQSFRAGKGKTTVLVR